MFLKNDNYVENRQNIIGRLIIVIMIWWNKQLLYFCIRRAILLLNYAMQTKTKQRNNKNGTNGLLDDNFTTFVLYFNDLRFLEVSEKQGKLNNKPRNIYNFVLLIFT